MEHATARLTSDAAALYFVKARWREADPLMRRVLSIDEQVYGPDHLNVAIRLNNLAVLLNADRPIVGRRAADATDTRHR